jgi:hypothetical protein
VAIIDENNIWAVGEIYLKDSSGQIDPTAYGFARWDGSKWNLLRVLFPTCDFQGNEVGSAYYPGASLFAFGANDIWITSGGGFVHWNGSTFQRTCGPFSLINGALTKLWGSSAANFFAVGRNGTIVHFNGSSWQKIESGTTMDVRNVWGGSKGGQTEILAIASKSVDGFDRQVLRIANSGTTALSDSGIAKEPMSGIWFSPGKKYYVVGSGVYRKNTLDDPRWAGHPLELTEFYSSDVHGADTNDVVVVGAFGDLLHYNGRTWRQYHELKMNGSFFSVTMNSTTVVAVGRVGNRAIALTGKRN